MFEEDVLFGSKKTNQLAEENEPSGRRRSIIWSNKHLKNELREPRTESQVLRLDGVI